MPNGFFGKKKLAKKSRKQKSDHHYQISHIRNSLGIKIQSNEFLDQINPKWVFPI